MSRTGAYRTAPSYTRANAKLVLRSDGLRLLEVRASATGFHDELGLHLAAPLVQLEVAVDRERAYVICAEVERHRVTRADALGNAVAVDREAVGDIFGLELDPYQIAFVDLESRRRKGILLRDDGERPLRRALFLGVCEAIG